MFEMNSKFAAMGIIAVATLMIATTIASMAPSAMAQRNIVGQNSQAANNANQKGLVNANVGVAANVAVTDTCVQVLSNTCTN
jgi:hypothetical protein